MNETLSAALITAMVIPWCVWATVSIFKINQEIALIKQEIKLMEEVKDVLEQIKAKL